MRLYFDTSAIVSIFLMEERTDAVTQLAGALANTVIISDLAMGEFGAAISTAVRTKRQTAAEGNEALGDFDAWCATSIERIHVVGSDIRIGTSHVRHFNLALLFPDALHLALCARANAVLVTGDHRQASAAKVMGLTVAIL